MSIVAICACSITLFCAKWATSAASKTSSAMSSVSVGAAASPGTVLDAWPRCHPRSSFSFGTCSVTG